MQVIKFYSSCSLAWCFPITFLSSFILTEAYAIDKNLPSLLRCNCKAAMHSWSSQGHRTLQLRNIISSTVSQPTENLPTFTS